MRSFFLMRWKHPGSLRQFLTALTTLVALVLRQENSLWGQESSVAAPDDATTKAGLQYKILWNSEAGSYTYAPEKWGDLRITLTNPRAEAREILCTTYFDQDPSLQYGRRLSLFPNSLLRISHPLLIPKSDPEKGRNLNLHSLVLDVSSGTEVMVKDDNGLLIHDGALTVTHGGRTTAVISSPGVGNLNSQSDVADMLSAGRVGQQLTNKFAVLSDLFLPADESLLKAFSHVVITDDRITNDYAACSALRTWLHTGGHLWVMLDKADPSVLRGLLGDDFSGTVVGRVGLTSVRIDKAPAWSDTERIPGETFEHDEPVEMVRLVTSQMDVSYFVDEWPAALTRSCGDGKLLITTLGARGWIKPHPPNSEKVQDPLKSSNFLSTTPLLNIASDFFRLPKPPLLATSTIEPLAREYIGYSIPSWGRVVGTLLGFSLAIVLIGVWMNRIGHLEHVSWIGSILAILVSAALLMVGRTSRHAIPATMASVQVIQSLGGTDAIRSEGGLAIYHPEGSEVSIEATQGGRMTPDMTGFEGTARRMVTTDLGVYHWANLPQPAGMRSTSFTHSQSVANRLKARATLDAEGITGQYMGPNLAGTDAMIATRNGRMGVTMKGDGTFVGRTEDVFQSGQFLAADLLSDEQDRRRRTLEQLLTNPKRKDYPDRPQLMFWTDPWDQGFHFGEGLTSRGTSLIVLPLLIDRPVNNTDLVIPSPLISYYNRRNPDGTLPSAMWDAARKEWQERSSPGLNWLSFLVPRELLPLAPRRARIDLSVTGPVGRIEIFGLKSGQVVSLKTIMDPVGSLSIDLNDVESLTIDSEGRLALGLSAGDPDRPELTHNSVPVNLTEEQNRSATEIDQNAKVNYWRIESLALQLWAKTIEKTKQD